MRRRALAVAATVAGVAGALLVPTGPALASGAAPVSLPAVSRVTLPTGDVARLSDRGGTRTATVDPATRSGPAGQFQQLTLNGDSYVFPVAARPFVGSVLDASLFDLDTLASTSGAAGIPVTLTHARGASFHVPGFRATSSTATSARGYLRPSAAFGTALARAWRAALRPGAPAPTSLFGGVTHLAVVGAAPATQPDFPQVTLVVKVLDENGQPAPFAFVGLINTDDSRKYVNFVVAYNGEARASVPLGHYSGITDVEGFSGRSFTDRIIPVADFTVTHNLQRVTFDARKATARPTVQTPRPADVNTLTVELDREAVRGGSLGSSFLYDGSSKVYVAPTRPAQVGDMQWLASWSLEHAADGPGDTPYSYDLSFVDYGAVSADQSQVVQPYQLATVDATYYNPSPGTSEFVRTAIYPFQFLVFGEFSPLHTPVERTEYVYANPTAVWSASFIAGQTRRNPFEGLVDDDLRVYPSGSHESVDWLRGPLASAPPEPTDGDRGFPCVNCRTDDTMFVELAPYTDTEPGHFGEVSDPQHGRATDFALYRDGVEIAGGKDRIGARVPVPAEAARYHIHLDVDRSADDPVTSTSTVTDLYYRSSAANGVAMPDDWTCLTHGTCRVLQLLKATVPLPTTLTDRLPIGRSTFDMTVAPFRGAGSDTITSVTFATSTDGGATFTPADVRRVSNEQYHVILDNPASSAGQPVTVRVTATDDHGGKLVQVTTAAYLVATS